MSYTAPSQRPYRSSLWTDITASSQQRMRYSLPPQCPIQFSAYGFDQSFQLAGSSFSPTAPLPKNTAAANFSADCTDANALLTSYSQPSDSGGGLLNFDASFQRVPAAWNDYSTSMPFLFPGFLNTPTGQPRRDPFTDVVIVRAAYDYFVLDPDNIISACADGVPADSATILDSAGNAVRCVFKLGDIPRIAKSNFSSIYSGTPDASTRSNSLVPSGGVVSSAGTYLETLPYPDTYKLWIAEANSTGWNSAVWDGTTNGAGTPAFGQLVAEDSRIEILAGNIVARVTLYVLAK